MTNEITKGIETLEGLQGIELLKAIKDKLELTSPLMEGREKGSTVLNVPMTIIDWDYLTDHKKNEDYVVYIAKEDNENFYFGGGVATDKFKKIDAMGEKVVASLKTIGIPVIFEEKTSKANNQKYNDMIIKL